MWSAKIQLPITCLALLLFAGGALPADGAADNAEVHWVEAEDLADDVAWRKVEHSPSYTSGNTASGSGDNGQLLGGHHGVGQNKNAPAIWKVTIRHAGRFKLWVRFHHVRYHGGFTVEIHQAGERVGTKTIDETEESHGRMWTYVWDGLECDLAAGPAEVRLARPTKGASWVARRIDLVFLTNDTRYQPSIMDLLTQAYVRYTNTATEGEPYCLWVWIRRTTRPWWGLPGMISRTGGSGSYYVPHDQRQWIAPGQRSPWVRLTPHLLKRGRNIAQFIATRRTHTAGHVTGERIQGRLEIAVGKDRRLVRTIPVDQRGPRIWVTFPGDVAAKPEEVRTGWEWFRVSREAVDAFLKANPEHGEAPSLAHLNVYTTFALHPTTDDPDLFRAEIDLLKDLGLNNLYRKGSEVDREALGMSTVGSFGGGLLYKCKNKCYNQPDVEKMQATVDKAAENWKDGAARVVLWKDADETAPNPLEHVLACDVCKTRFITYLKEKKLGLATLGIAAWDAAVPVAHEDREKRPALYFHTQMFRLDAFRRHAKRCQDMVREKFPNAHSYNNVSPPVTSSMWMNYQGGSDPYIPVRNGMGMAWSEDWRAYGAGPMHYAYLLSQMRVACRPERKPMGMYVVIGSGSIDELRVKLYEDLAGGARHLCLYSYGPGYAGLDDWSARTDRYPVIREVLTEFARADEALHNTTRRLARTAVLYNRTAGIWEAADGDSAAEMDAQFLYWALRHAGYDADVIPEEDVEAGDLERYRVLYLGGRFLRRKTAEAIAAWVKGGEGRVLVGTAGVASRDEYNRPLDVLADVFGVGPGTLEKKAKAGRPAYEMRTLKPLGRVQATVDGSEAAFDRLCWLETGNAVADDAEVIGRDQEGKPAIVKRRVGKGTAIRFFALPGLAYVREALVKCDRNEAPTGFKATLRDLLVMGAGLSGVARVAETDAPLVAFTRYDGPDRAVFFVINHGYDPLTALVFTVPDAAGYKKAVSARRRTVSMTVDADGRARVTLEMDRSTDIVVLRR